MINKYYVGARHIGEAVGRGVNAPITHSDIEGALQEAKDKIQKGESETVVVVKIVAIVRREQPPVRVELLDYIPNS